MNSTKDMKITFLGISPRLKDETGELDPQQIASLSALLTFKGKTVQSLKQDAVEKGQDVAEKAKKIMMKASLRGHASIATTPVFSFSYEASKFLDSMLTGLIFSSSLMASGRRTETDIKNIIFPTAIEKNKQAKELYKKTSINIVNFLNGLLEKGVAKDEASKILQYGIYGTGIISLSIESLLTFRREYESEKEWMPEEAGMLLNEIEKELKKMGIDILYTSRSVAPRNFYPYPNIFKNPKTVNIVREFVQQGKMKNESNVVALDCLQSQGLKKRVMEINARYSKMYKDKKNIKRDWFEIMAEIRNIARDYMNVLSLKVLSSISWRVWGEKKRHRTVPMVSESIYYCIDRAVKIYGKYRKEIAKGSLTEKMANELDEALAIPPTVKQNKEFLAEYAKIALESLDCYRKLVKMGIKPKDAIFVIPRAVRIDVFQEYNLFNLISGYYPLRLCKTAEEQMRRLTTIESIQIENILKKKKMDWLLPLIKPKCFASGFCPEEGSCGKIKAAVKNYDEKFDAEMKKDLEDRFEKDLKRIEK
jgi:hypothetical protein